MLAIVNATDRYRIRSPGESRGSDYWLPVCDDIVAYFGNELYEIYIDRMKGESWEPIYLKPALAIFATNC